LDCPVGLNPSLVLSSLICYTFFTVNTMKPPDEIAYCYGDQVSPDELFHLLDRMAAYTGDRIPARNVFHVPLRTPEKERTSLTHTISVTARKSDGTLVGYLRILTDHAYIFYILDVMVAPDWRKRGVGKRLMQMAVERCKADGFIKIFLTAIPGTEGFYRPFGFKEGMSPVLTIRGEEHL
jgi:GNAT superfamily N-acetyltransferase